jgi:hypothetical protein
MEKLKLELDDLTVTSFDTSDTDEGRGTVEAHDPTRHTGCPTCDTLCPTCHTLCLPYC